MSQRAFHKLSRSDFGVIGAVILLAIVIRLIALNLDSLWYDEVFSIRVAQLSPTGIISFTHDDVHSPFYYLLLHFWIRLFGDSGGVVRLLSVCFSIMTVGTVYLLALELFNRRAAFFTALLTTLAPFQVFYANETRMYSQLTFFTAISTYFLIRWWKDGTRTSSILYAIFATLLLYSHFYAAFVVTAQFVYSASLLFVEPKTRTRLRSWLMMNLAIGALFLPWALVVLQQVTRAKRGFWIKQPDWLMPFQALIEFSGSLYLALLLLLLFVYGVRRYGDKNQDHPGNPPHLRVFLLLWLILPIGVPFLLSKLMSPFFLVKYAIAASLPFYLFAAWGLAQVRGKKWQVILLLLMCAGFVVKLSSDLTTLKRERWRDAAYNVEQAAQPGDLIVFDSAGSYMNFKYYANRPDVSAAFFPYSATDQVAPSNLVLLQRVLAEGFGSLYPAQSAQEATEKLRRIVGTYRRVWVVSRYGDSFRDELMKAFGGEFRAVAQAPLCVSQRRFLFMEWSGAEESAIVLERRGLSCAPQVSFLER